MDAPNRLRRLLHLGGCHCGRVRFEVRAAFDRATQCNCSICTLKAYLHHMVPPADFRLLSGADDLSSYAFGTCVARHLFCRFCGVAPFFRPRRDPAQYMINLRCIDELDLAALSVLHFDGRGWESRRDAPYTGVWGFRTEKTAVPDPAQVVEYTRGGSGGEAK